MKVLVTGAAGFIGAAVCARLIQDGAHPIGIDSLTDYYDVALKRARLERLHQCGEFTFMQTDCAARDDIDALFRAHRFDAVVHLAAQAGVRYSLDNPQAYIDANLTGFGNILEGCRAHAIAHLVFASSSSVYGGNARLPFVETDSAEHPLSLYAATKKANEMMAHSYAHLYRLSCTGLRFFTVYGPWGRPDMAFFKFAELMLQDKPIPVYNCGRLRRDFTYIDDVVEAVMRILKRPARAADEYDARAPNPAISDAPYRLYNIGCGATVELNEYIDALEAAFGVTARREMLPMQPGDVVATHADISALMRDFDFAPRTDVRDGLAAFADWYRNHYAKQGAVK